jgi:predicted phosphodiesterase
MRIAVISDIHGNLEAFRQVLKDMEQMGVDKVICLGDNIGYGPEPNEVVHLINELDIACTMGNHELGIAQPEYMDWFNDSAKQSLLITLNLLNQDALHHIRALEPFLVEAGALFVHGCPPDMITTYLFQLTDVELEALFLQIDQKISFVGHTHNLKSVCFDGRAIHHFRLARGTVDIGDGRRYIINIGSVGQPRDGNNNAKYVIWDTLRQEIEARFVSYDIAKTASRILELGFPKINASRLW